MNESNGSCATHAIDAISTGQNSTLLDFICLLVTLRHIKLLIAASQLGTTVCDDRRAAALLS